MSGSAFSLEDFIKKPAVELGDISFNCAEIRQAVFNGAKIGHVNAPNLTFVNDNAFVGSRLSSIYAPEAYGAGAGAFQNATGIQYLVFPKMRIAYSYTFLCSAIAADFGGTPGSGEGLIRGNMFGSGLETLVLRANVVWPLQGVSTFNGTKFASGKSGGTLYVPQSMISSYESDSVWGTLLGYTNNSIEAIEGSAYETHYVDGSAIGS